MNTWINDLVAQFKELPIGRQLALLLTAVGSLAFFLWLGLGASENDYRVLYRGLDEDQAMQVVTGLEAEKIPYRLSEGGGAISVPAPSIHEARIRIAGRGLPGSGAGFEIFDNAGFGVTDFVQKVNFARALQGELARSIEQLEAVERARVNIALPERSAFVRPDDAEATASVVVRLRADRQLSPEQVEGMVHLVASSIPGLSGKDVTIVDTKGRMLAPVADGSAGPGAPSGAMAQQKKIESELRERIESMLERTVGMGRVIARVHADLDWTQAEHTEERYDPDSQVARSEQRSTDSTTDAEAGGGEGGAPGVGANDPTELEALPAGVQHMASRSNEVINYEINKTVSRRVDPVGRIQRLDVAILVDGKPSAAAPAESGEAPEFTPWTDEELQQFEQLAMRAVGFSQERGDLITVTSAPFRSIELEPVSGFALEPQYITLLTTLLNYLGLIIALVLFARMVGKPLVTQLAKVPLAPASITPEGAVTAGELESKLAGAAALGEGSGMMLPDLEDDGPLSLSQQVGMITDVRSDDSVKTIRGWLDQ